MADQAVAATRALFALVAVDRGKVMAGRSTSMVAVRRFEFLPEHPTVSIGAAVALLATTKPTPTKVVAALLDAGVLVETRGRRRDRRFSYAAYLDILRAGTEIESGR